MSRLTQTIPALPVRDMTAAVAFYRDRLGFEVLHHDGGFAVLPRRAALHLGVGDETWQRSDMSESPVRSGAESFIAGTASCRIMCEGVDELFDELRAADVLHPVSKDGVDDDGLRDARVRDARPRRQLPDVLPLGDVALETPHRPPVTLEM